jgi:hypothetical protein
MSIIDIYVDSICAISQSSVDSLHVPSDNAASSDAAPSELEPHVNTPIRQLRACTCMVLLRMTYQNSRSQGLTEKIVHGIRHLEMCAILLGIMWYFGGAIPSELLQEKSLMPAELKKILIPQARSSLGPIMGKTTMEALLFALHASDVALKFYSKLVPAPMFKLFMVLIDK